MVIPEKGNGNTMWLTPPAQAAAPKKIPFYELDTAELKKFFDFTGGSILYCLSAVFVAYGIVNVMGPMLSMGEALKNALPCIFTLHAYELALLGVLILIVSRKVVDDAISVVILIAIFLVGTSIALGSVADTGITASLWLGLLGIALALAKFCAMRRFAKMPFGLILISGLLILMACNYFGPALLARSITVAKMPESSRRELWWLIWLVMLIGAGFALTEAMSAHPRQKTQDKNQTPLLQTSIMSSIFALIVIGASATHQYAMAYTNGLQRVMGDYVPIIAAGTLIVLEILRLSGKRSGFAEAVISCVPLAVTMFAIEEKSVLSGSKLGLGLLGYPPVILALTGLAIVCWSLYRRKYMMLAVGVLYGLGVVLTFGFSPEHPYDLNVHACVRMLAAILLVYGLFLRNPYVCTAGVIVLCGDFSRWGAFRSFSTYWELTQIGSLAGIYGLGFVVLCIIFGSKMHKALRIIGAISLAIFVFDYLPGEFHWRYAIVLVGMVLFMGCVWFRTKDILTVSIPLVPFFIKLYIAAKQIAYWRAVIVGFLLLGAGAAASILKIRSKERADSLKSQLNEGDSSLKL
ncbi:MAG: hypothetical protein ABSH16_03890 [Sedimentisphaerales bacterium]